MKTLYIHCLSSFEELARKMGLSRKRTPTSPISYTAAPMRLPPLAVVVALPPESALVDLPVRSAREGHAVVLQLYHGLGRFLGRTSISIISFLTRTIQRSIKSIRSVSEYQT